MRWLAIVLAGCASAGAPDNPGVDSNTGSGDGSIKLDGSMGMTDASGPMSRTLTQTTSQTLKAANSIACGNSTGTAANNYYRVFDLAMMGITGPFAVSKVSFQVEHCHANAGTGCTLAVRVGTYSMAPGATLATANMTILASNASVTVPEIIETGTTTPGGTVDAPLTATIPAGQRLLVEIDAPDGANVYAFYIGTNDGGESGLGYILAPTCSINAPTSISAVGTAAPRHMLLTVTGTY